MKHSHSIMIGMLLVILSILTGCDEKINRAAVVGRHQVENHEVDTLNSLTLGNGRFAMTMDITGLQTFPLVYHKGVPLGTQSEWGWHSFPNESNYTLEETLEPLTSRNRQIPYARQWPSGTREGEAADYFRQNPHRIHLAILGFSIKKSDGSFITLTDIKKTEQYLNLWKGELTSRFEIEGIPVEVISLVSQENDFFGVKVKSDLITDGRLGVNITYPYPAAQFLDEAACFDSTEIKRLEYIADGARHFAIQRILDTTRYFTTFTSSRDIISASRSSAGFCIMPDPGEASWAFFFELSPQKSSPKELDFESFRQKVHADFKTFWSSGAMIDFAKVKDARARELERRMVLSLYLTKVNCGGSSFPQETGLTYNSWYGRPHMEMAWWHGVHFALWGRPEMLEKQMEWYLRSIRTAEAIAKRQGFKGVRWQKMTDNNGGETASSVGSYLIWQQPHIIYFAELLYRITGKKAILDKYNNAVEQTAEFMADFACYDSIIHRYSLHGLIPAQECFDPAKTFNPAYELAYWRWALETARLWRERAGIDRNDKWDKVLMDLSRLPQKDSLYLATESTPDAYSNPEVMRDHPSVLGTYGMLPATKGLDKTVMKRTFYKVWDHWLWTKTWGWDFPMAAMTATRLRDPEKAVDALLMPVETNTYLKNGHNYQNQTLRIYLPGNGGFLTALAMMAEGTDESPSKAPGFPPNWDIKAEGFNRMP